MADREFLLKVVGDVADAQKSLGKLEQDVSGFSKGVTDAATAIGAVVAVDQIVDWGKAMVGAASDQEQAIGAVNSVFGEYADTIHAASKDAADSLGMSIGQYEQLSTLTGALLKNAGVPLDEVAQSAKDLTQVGADLSAMYGGTAVDAMGAINSALKGEMDPLEAFGVSLKASAIEAKALKMGLVDSAGKVTDYGKKMATVALIQEQAADSAGTFAEEADSIAGRTQIMQAQFTNLQAELGAKLLPVVVTFANVLMGLIGFVQDNQEWLGPIVLVLGSFATVIGTVIAATKAWAIAQGILNTVMALNPIVLVVAAVAALVAGVIIAYKKVDWFRELVDESAAAMVKAWEWIVSAVESVWEAIKFAYDWVKNNWPLLLAIITGPFGLAVYAIARYWDDLKRGVQAAIDAVVSFFSQMPGRITSALGWLGDKIAQPFKDGFNAVQSAIDSVVGWFERFPDKLASAWYGLDDVIFAPFKAAFSAIKSWWNSTVGGFGFNVPGWVPGVGGKGFNIPKMAKGGIVTRPTIAMIGEAGREAVIPLDRAGGFGNVVINVYALTANAEVGRRVYEALREYERTSGRSIGPESSGGVLTVFAA